MRLTEEQLKTVIAETAKKVLKEYAYHEKQNKPSEEEHAEWLRKKSESKKKYMDSQKKEDDGGAIDHYDYKHGKGNFPVMAKESRVRMSAKDFQAFITESVKSVIKEMSGLPRSYDSWRTREPEYFSKPDMISKDDFMDAFYSQDKNELLEWVKDYAPEVYEEAVTAERDGTENVFNVVYERLGWKEIASEFLDMKPVNYYPGDNDPDPRDVKGLDEGNSQVMAKESVVRMSLDDFRKFITESVKNVLKEWRNDETGEIDGGYKPKFVWVDSRVKGVGSSWYYGGTDTMKLDELQSFLDRFNACVVYDGNFYTNVNDIPFKPARHSIETYGMPTGRYTESEPTVTVVPNGTTYENPLGYSNTRRYKFPDGFRNDFDHEKEQKPDRDWRKNQ